MNKKMLHIVDIFVTQYMTINRINFKILQNTNILVVGKRNEELFLKSVSITLYDKLMWQFAVLIAGFIYSYIIIRNCANREK